MTRYFDEGFVLEHNEEQHMPMFDWRQLFNAADKIVDFVQNPKKHSSAHSIDIKYGLDLSSRRESIAKLLADVFEEHALALQDFKMRSDPNKPHRCFEKNIIDDGSPVDDYGEHSCSDEEAKEYWRKTYNEMFYRPPGNPGTSRSGGAPTKPVEVVYHYVRAWWREEGLGRFSPLCDPERTAADGQAYDESRLNNPARFLLAVLRRLDASYNPESVRSLHENLRRPTKRKQKRKRAVSSKQKRAG